MPNVSRPPSLARQAWPRAVWIVALVTGCAGDSAIPARKEVPASSRRVLNELANATPVAASLRDVMATGALVGRRVRVRGRCLPHEGDHLPAQPPSLSTEWRLVADGIAVFVVGPLPGHCVARGDVMVTITAMVAEDTLAAIGDLPASPRRFLVVAEEREE